MRAFLFLLVILTSFGLSPLAQQTDSAAIKGPVAIALTDSTPSKHSPRKATIRSAILPGWGQVYNKKIWKVPIVYAALGITGGVFNYNLKQYKKVRFAYITLRDEVTADYPKVDPQLQPFIAAGDVSSLQRYRNEFRKNIDYSVLFFVLFWGLNVVDATVDGHLKDFDVGNNLSLRVKPTFNTSSNLAGVGLVFTLGKNQTNRLSSLR